MSDTISITGLVATTPRHLVTGEGLAITSFRLASTQRRFDRGEQKWVDGDTNWYTVTAFRQLATNVVGSVVKGQRVVVQGRLRVRQWQNDERQGTSVEIDAEALGHDLSWGTAVFSRTVASSVGETQTVASAEGEAPGEEAPMPGRPVDGAGLADDDEAVDELAAARAQHEAVPLPF